MPSSIKAGGEQFLFSLLLVVASVEHDLFQPETATAGANRSAFYGGVICNARPNRTAITVPGF